MTRRPVQQSVRDDSPWTGGGAMPRERPQSHSIETTSAGYVCEACGFASQDVAEATAHLVASQFGVRGAGVLDDGGAA